MINAIKINLNQAAGKAARLETIRERGRWAVFAVTSLVLIITLLFMYQEDQKMADLVAQKESQIEKMTSDLDKLKASGKDLSRDDIFALAKLESERVLWAEKLENIGRLMPHDMALTNVVFKDNYLIMTGISRIYNDEREFDVINEFIARLENDAQFMKDFDKIIFNQSMQMTVLEQDLISFEIRGELKKLKFIVPPLRKKS
jgi:Tfp pilus assembly protein PilN